MLNTLVLLNVSTNVTIQWSEMFDGLIEIGMWGFACVIIGFILYLIFRSPFHYPYFNYGFDVSGKRNPQIEDLIDTLLIIEGFSIVEEHEKEIKSWKIECQRRIRRSVIRGYRKSQYERCLDDKHAFRFYLVRHQTRYRQVNYRKIPYKVDQVVKTIEYSYIALCDRNELLSMINYECTLREYHSKNQRKLMTPELREQIAIRDNYTCQLCGKYMPDTVGLHVDHIIPISKGGKTVPSNLQVLCSKCNGKKSNK